MIFILFKIYPKSIIDVWQNMIRDKISTTVVMNGLATTVGSRWHFLARSGRQAPITFAAQTVTKSEIETASEIFMVYS